MKTETEISQLSDGIASIVYSYDVIAYLFGLIILLSFLKLLFSKNIDEYFKKIIGGLSILVFALVSKNNFIIGISIFIGGLLIATENFLIHLAGIFSNKKGDDLSKIYNSFTGKVDNSIEEEEITEEQKINEIKKEKEEKEEIKKEISEDSKKRYSNKHGTPLYKDIIETENKVLDSFENKFKSFLEGKKIGRDIRIKNKYGNIALDGIIKNNNEYELGLEVKILKPESHIFIHIRRYIERIRYMKFNFPFVLIIASEKLDLNEVNRAKEVFGEFDDIFLLFFEYGKNIELGKFLNELNFSKIINKNNESGYGRIIKVDGDLVTVLFENGTVKTINKNEFNHSN